MTPPGRDQHADLTRLLVAWRDELMTSLERDQHAETAVTISAVDPQHGRLALNLLADPAAEDRWLYAEGAWHGLPVTDGYVGGGAIGCRCWLPPAREWAPGGGR